MKLSCLPVSLYPALSAGEMSLPDWFAMAHRLGLDGADLSVAHLQDYQPADLQTLRRQAQDAGVEIMMLVTYSDFTHPSADYRAAQIDALRANIEAATHLGASALRVTAGQAHPGVSRAEGIRWAVEGLTACLPSADAAGVTLAYENHTIGYGWTARDFSQPADIFLEIVAQTKNTALKILFDTVNNQVINDDPLAVLEKITPRVAVVHTSDIRREGEFEPVVIGTGVSPIKAIFQHLQASGFNGWVSVEEASRTGEAGFQRAIAFVDRTWVEAGGTGRGIVNYEL